MSFAEQSLETKTADVDPSACETNRANLADLLQACEGQLSDASLPAERGDTGPHLSYAKIDRGAVEAFLSGFRPGPSDAHFSAPGDDGSLVAEYVRAEGHRHGDLWDVAVIAGKGQRAALPGVATSVPSNVRDTATAEEGRRRHLAFASRRLASERNLVDIAEKLQNGRTDRWALASGGDGVLKERVVPMVIDRPILMIYPISWSPDEVPAGWGRISPEDGVLGLKVTFPAVRDAHGQIIYAREAKTYVVNRVFLAEAGLLEELDGGDDE